MQSIFRSSSDSEVPYQRVWLNFNYGSPSQTIVRQISGGSKLQRAAFLQDKCQFARNANLALLSFPRGIQKQFQ
jgi:hypothetical protein